MKVFCILVYSLRSENDGHTVYESNCPFWEDLCSCWHFIFQPKNVWFIYVFVYFRAHTFTSVSAASWNCAGEGYRGPWSQQRHTLMLDAVRWRLLTNSCLSPVLLVLSSPACPWGNFLTSDLYSSILINSGLSQRESWTLCPSKVHGQKSVDRWSLRKLQIRNDFFFFFFFRINQSRVMSHVTSAVHVCCSVSSGQRKKWILSHLSYE